MDIHKVTAEQVSEAYAEVRQSVADKLLGMGFTPGEILALTGYAVPTGYDVATVNAEIIEAYHPPHHHDGDDD